MRDAESPRESLKKGASYLQAITRSALRVILFEKQKLISIFQAAFSNFPVTTAGAPQPGKCGSPRKGGRFSEKLPLEMNCFPEWAHYDCWKDLWMGPEEIMP